MNFYPHHIGDFNNATRHLTRVERSVYRDAIDLYYDTENALTLEFEKLARRLLCIIEEEKSALKTILHDFFIKTDDGYLHERCEKEIAKYRANTSNKSKAGKASAEKRKKKSTPVQHNDTVCATNQEPITINQEPITKSRAKTSTLATRLPPDWQPTEEQIQFCKTERPELNPLAVAARFRDHWIAEGGAKGRKADWTATWRNWVRSERFVPKATQDKSPPKDWT